jgi:putative spermidine/putrescine transport system substrate-binding protein
LLSHMVSPAAQAEFHKYVSYGPITPKAWDSIPKESWSRLPSSPDILKQSVFLDAQWWVENGDAMRERYQATISQ